MSTPGEVGYLKGQEEMWRDKAIKLEAERVELTSKLAEAQTTITYWITEGDRIRGNLNEALKVIDVVRSDANNSLNKYIEAKDHVTALLMGLDAVELADVKNLQAVTKAWAYHWGTDDKG